MVGLKEIQRRKQILTTRDELPMTHMLAVLKFTWKVMVSLKHVGALRIT